MDTLARWSLCLQPNFALDRRMAKSNPAACAKRQRVGAKTQKAAPEMRKAHPGRDAP
jgi:hypothetical protein